MIPVQTLRSIARIQGLSQSDLARMAGVSRQAVSLWFRKGRSFHLRADHLLNLSKALKIPVNLLVSPMPLSDPREREAVRTFLLWDGLYPSLEAFALALDRREPQALGRLVESYGLYDAAKIAGEVVWDAYPEYRRFVHPARRKALDRVWSIAKSPTSG